MKAARYVIAVTTLLAALSACQATNVEPTEADIRAAIEVRYLAVSESAQRLSEMACDLRRADQLDPMRGYHVSLCPVGPVAPNSIKHVQKTGCDQDGPDGWICDYVVTYGHDSALTSQADTKLADVLRFRRSEGRWIAMND